MSLSAGDPIPYWKVTPLREMAYDVPDAPMEGKMDSTFFLTKDKNIIPHTYPCRTAYIAEAREVEPMPAFQPDWSTARNVLPMGSAFLDLSGFWFRATRLMGWAKTAVHADAAGPAKLRLGICGAAKLFVNGQPCGWLAPAARNAMHEVDIDVTLRSGNNEITVWFEDLAERDAVVRVFLIWIDGPQASAAYPYAADPAIVRAVEASIEAAHLNAKHYDNAEIWLELPVPLPQAAIGSVAVAGHFMAHDTTTKPIQIAQWATRVPLAHSSDILTDYRYFHIDLTCGGFTTRMLLGAEVANMALLGAAPDTLPGRIAEALHWIGHHAETDTEKAVACLDLGTPDMLAEAERIITHALPGIEACFDCADFALVPLLWCRTVYADRISAPLRDRIDAAALAYRYWMDEPGNDVQWYFSENHALLFHTAAYIAGLHLSDRTFARSGRTGANQSATGLARLRDWFDHFEASEMAEFNSAPYFPIDLKGLTTLFALAPDADIRDRARAAIIRLVTVMANSAHQGVMTGAQGRSYEHTLCATETLELTSIARLLWGRGGFGAHVNCLAQLALCLRDHNLTLPDLGDRALWSDHKTAQEWTFWQGKNAFARLYHYKTADTAIGTAARYRWGDWGYQETLIHARLGQNPRAQIWINYPGEMVQSGYGRPSFWGGSANVPRVQQYRDLAIVKFDGVAAQLPFTHAWFPTPCLDRWDVSGNRAQAQSGNGMALIRASGTLDLQTTGGSANHELRLSGQDGMWVLRLGRGRDLAAFGAAHDLAPTHHPDGTITIADTEYGLVIFEPSGKVRAEGRVLDPMTWTLTGERTLLPV